MSSLLHKRGWVYEGEPDLKTIWQQIEQKYFSEYVAGNLTLAEHRRERMRELGYVLAVLTNGQQDQQERKLAKMGLSHFFSSILAIGKMTYPKPDARAFLQMCASLECEPEEVVYVGDDPHVDVLAATRAGIHGVWLNREDVPTQIGIRSQISTLNDLQTIIRNARADVEVDRYIPSTSVTKLVKTRLTEVEAEQDGRL